MKPADVGPRKQKGRGYSTSSGLTERWRSALLKQPDSGPTAWQRGQTLEIKDGPTSNPRKRGDEIKLPSPSRGEGDACEARRGCTKPNPYPDTGDKGGIPTPNQTRKPALPRRPYQHTHL